jgi:hypothetical protein
MIAVSSSSARFGKLVHYLEHGHNGTAVDRVAWTSARNLVDPEPAIAAQIMQATAASNPRATEPVYHMAISFHPEDTVTRPMMERVADRLLTELGLTGHQTLIVAHKDRQHAHFHLVVNRIHPHTTRAWDRWQDYVTTQRVLRQEERELGIREVRGRLHQLPGQQPPERTAATAGEYRNYEKTGETPLIGQARAHLAHYRAATTWPELETRLAAHGLRLERKGQGLVITDGEREAKASRIARDFSFASLQARLGPSERATPIPSIAVSATAHTRQAAQPDIQPGHPITEDPVAGVAHRVQDAERAADLDRAMFRAQRDLDAARIYLADVHAAHAAAKRADRAFDRHLAALYRDSADARARFDAARHSVGMETAVHQLRTMPRAYGALRPAHRTVLGVVPVPDDRRGLTRATHTATAGHDMGRTAADLRARLANTPPGMRRAYRTDAFARAISDGHLRERNAARRLARLHERRQGHPDASRLSRELAALVRAFAPRDVARLTLWLTAPQLALVSEARRAVRHIALGQGR